MDFSGQLSLLLLRNMGLLLFLCSLFRLAWSPSLQPCTACHHIEAWRHERSCQRVSFLGTEVTKLQPLVQLTPPGCAYRTRLAVTACVSERVQELEGGGCLCVCSCVTLKKTWHNETRGPQSNRQMIFQRLFLHWTFMFMREHIRASVAPQMQTFARVLHLCFCVYCSLDRVQEPRNPIVWLHANTDFLFAVLHPAMSDAVRSVSTVIILSHHVILMGTECWRGSCQNTGVAVPAGTWLERPASP